MDICKVDGCDIKIKQNGYCSKHYSQIYRHGRLTPEKERQKYNANTKCNHEGCKEIAKTKGYCLTHYSQKWRYGKTYDKYEITNTIKDMGEYALLIISTSRNKHIANVIIDKDKIGKVEKYTWHYYGRYVLRRDRKTSLHRYLTNAPQNKVVDHINHNTLDNRMTNLRICTVAENTRHHQGYETNTSGRTGIYAESGKWRARIKMNYKQINLGTFKEKSDAIKAREKAEEELYRDYKPKK